MIDTTRIPKTLRPMAGLMNASILAAAFWIATGVIIAVMS